MATIQTDVCVIGAGPGGLSAAAKIAGTGLKTVLIERDETGGGLRNGCMMSKAMASMARRACLHDLNKVEGIKSHLPQIDASLFRQYLTRTATDIQPGISLTDLEKLGVQILYDEAVFISPHEVRAAGNTVKARYYIIATGARPRTPMIPGISMQDILSSHDIFKLQELPEHLVIVGGDSMALEIAQAHKRMGCQVTVIDKNIILRHEDRENTSILRGALLMEGIHIYESTSIKSAEKNEDGFTLTLSADEEIREIRCSHVMACAGRAPNVEALNLWRAGVNYNKDGIFTDTRLRSSQKHIFAIGDVSHHLKYHNYADHHADIAAKNICFKIRAKLEDNPLPRVTFTSPEVAQAGLTEEAARKKYNDKIIITTSSFADNHRAVLEGAAKGQIRIIHNKKGRIYGVSLIGPQAGELIGLWVLAMTKKLKLKDIAGITLPYPTLGEISPRAASGEKPTLWSEKFRKEAVRLLQKLPL